MLPYFFYEKYICRSESAMTSLYIPPSGPTTPSTGPASTPGMWTLDAPHSGTKITKLSTKNFTFLKPYLKN